MSESLHPRRIQPAEAATVGVVGSDRLEPVPPYERGDVSISTADVQPPGPHADDAVTLPLRKLVAGLCRNRFSIFALCSLCTLVAVGYALLLPNTYVSHGSFLLKRGSEEVAVAPMGNDDEPLRNASLLGNAPYILTSTELFRRVVQRVGVRDLVAPPPPPSDGARSASLFGAVRGWVADTLASLRARANSSGTPGTMSLKKAVDVFASRLKVDSPAKSSLLTVDYVCPDPEAAEKVLGIYMEEAVKRHMEVYADETGIQLVEANHKKAVKAVATARADLEKFLHGLGVSEFEPELAARREQLDAARVAEQTLRNKVRDSEVKLEELRDRVAKLPATIESRETVKGDNPRIAALEEMISKRQRERQELETTLRRESDPAFQKIDRVLSSLREDLLQARMTPEVEQTQVRIAPNPQIEAFKARVAELSLEHEVEKRSLTQAESRRELAEKQHAQLANHREDYQTLTAALARARTDLEHAETSVGMARAKRMLNMAEVSSLTPLQEPTAAQKEGPRRAKIAITGLLLGLFLGLGLAFLRTVTDGTIRSTDDLDELGAGPVLASLPRLDRRTMARHVRMRRRGC